MRIVVIATAASTGGAVTILQSLRDSAAKDNSQHTWKFLISSKQIEPGPGVEIALVKWPKSTWIHRLYFEFFGKKTLERFHPDVVVSLQNTLPLGLTCPTVLYIHQPLPFDQSIRFKLISRDYKLAIYQRFIGRLICSSARRASSVIVQTKWIKESVSELSGVDPEIIKIIPPEVDVLADVPNLPEAKLQTNFFYPTSNSKYKNIELLAAATDVLMERESDSFTVEATTNGLELSQNITQIGVLSRQETHKRIANSVLVFPSLSESYGLPLMEARILNSIILAADLPYAHEVLEGYENAYFFSPTDPADLVDLMTKVLSDEISRSYRPDSKLPKQDSWKRMMEIIEMQS